MVLADMVPFPLVTRGKHGFWGASEELAALAIALREALASEESTKQIVIEIGEELFNEGCPTPDEWDVDEDAYWERQREIMLERWEAEADLYGVDAEHDGA